MIKDLRLATTFDLLALATMAVGLGGACASSATQAPAGGDLPKATANAKDGCVVAAEIQSWKWTGVDLESASLLVSSGKVQEGAVFKPSRILSHGEGFFFTSVPPGEFRVQTIKYAYAPGTDGTDGRPSPVFDNRVLANAATRNGDVPNEMSGTCAGGFIWLGTFVAESGLVSGPTLTRGNDLSSASAQSTIKERLAGSRWGAEIDRPLKSTPLPKGKQPEFIVNAEEQKEAVAAVAGQTRTVTMPKSDPGALEAAAGTWVLQSINGKPLPYLFTANKCTMFDSMQELKADGIYSTSSNMECGGNKLSFPTSGMYGVVGGNVTYAVAVGPEQKGVVTTIAGDALTTKAGADTYVSKKK